MSPRHSVPSYPVYSPETSTRQPYKIRYDTEPDSKRYGLDVTEAGKRFYICDADGLITKVISNMFNFNSRTRGLLLLMISCENTLLQSRKNLKEMEDLFYDLSNFAAEENEWEGMGLKDVVEKVKPDILIGLSGVGGIFTGFSNT